MNAVGDRCAQEPTVVVLDEYPYLAKAYPAISSVLQQKIDLLYQNIPGAMLIICGSSMPFMEHQVLGYQSPLYGRRTAQIRLQPFSFFEIQPFFESYPPEDLAVMYGVTGGIPKYLSIMNASISVQENIRDQFFSTSGYLYEEPENLLKQELREPAVYNSIIRAVAQGCSKNTDLTSSLGFSSSKLAPYLSRLLELGILKKETPALSPEGRKSRYSVNDGLFRFWYLTVPRQNMLIQRGYSD